MIYYYQKVNGISSVKRNHVGQAVVRGVLMSIYLISTLIGFVIGMYIGFGLALIITANRRINTNECNGHAER